MLNKLWLAGILFLICSCVHVYSASVGVSEYEVTTDSLEEITTSSSYNSRRYLHKPRKPLNQAYTSTLGDSEDAGDLIVSTTNSYDELSSTSYDIENTNYGYKILRKTVYEATEPTRIHPTWRPLRQNCTPPFIEQFPKPLMPPLWRRHGGLIIHVFVAVFAFLCLKVICKEYFVPNIAVLCNELKLPHDVAGATFMAAGSSAPELATLIIGVFFAQDDIGPPIVIGSAVFNILFVVSICALCSGAVLKLNWWPMVRDCAFYLLSIFFMFIFICNDVVSWPEALFMLLLYAFYCVALRFNLTIKQWASMFNPHKEEPLEPETVVLNNVQEEAQNDAFWTKIHLIRFICQRTVPDVKTEKYRNRYIFTFLISMIWISFYSFFLVWMIVIIGTTLGIPDAVMGLTFIAAGFSVPNALNSLAVIKDGYGDMAISNVIGSNILNALVCLGLPWFIQTAVIAPGSHVNVLSKGLVYSGLPLLVPVAILLMATYFNGWKLDQRLGLILMVVYFIFISIASLYELNVFGVFIPPDCMSNY